MDEQDLLERFHRLEAPASRLTVEAVVRAGRRRTRLRRTAQAGCAAALVAGALIGVPQLPGFDRAAPGVAGRAGSCEATRLPVPAGAANVWAVTVDPTGRYIAGYAISGPFDVDPATNKRTGTVPSRPVLWIDGRAQELPAPQRAVQPAAVNAAGVVVAVAGDRKRFDSVLRYVGGEPQQALLPAGSWEVGPDARINAEGDILFNATLAGQPDTKNAVMLWKAGASRATRLPLPPGADGKALTEDGAVVGELPSDASQLTSYVWDQAGNGRKLTAPRGQQATVNAGRGDWATGNAWPSGGAIRWNLKTGELTTYDGVHAPAQAINSRGWLLTDDTLRRDDGATEVVPLVEGEARSFSSDLSDDGTVVGSLVSVDATGATTSLGPLTWRCGG
ncbi:hypothetical protein [Actinoplanes sp. NPDC048796]|uniref:hypothetical protein n=1 Tax=unclassified Actinoplanes TaxID=2626549 RepID=UPI0033EEDD90